MKNHRPNRPLRIFSAVVGAIFFFGRLAGIGAQTPIEAESVLLRVIDQVDVPANSAGILAGLHVTEGTAVKAGQLLANVDDFESALSLERARLEQNIAKMQIANDVSVRTAETEFHFAKKNYERMKKAADSLPGSVSEAELAQLQLEGLRAKLQLEDANRTLELAKATLLLKENDLQTMQRKVEIQKILAPIGGHIEHVLHRKGEWVKPGDNVVRIISLRRLRAEGFVRSDGSGMRLKDAKVQLAVEQAGKTKHYPGKVVFVHSEMDPVNGRMRVWAEIDNSRNQLRPGMRAKMTIHPANTE